jgi:glycosyltransferase involved in cell wall biosynthesis
MYQLTSLIRHKPEVYLSRSVALISESGFRVPHDTSKDFLYIFSLFRLTACLTCYRRTWSFFFSIPKCCAISAGFSLWLADFQPETFYILSQFSDKVALEGRGFKPKNFGNGGKSIAKYIAIVRESLLCGNRITILAISSRTLSQGVNRMICKNNLQVSIIIDNYNSCSFLKEAIDSALNQTYPNLEIIVVDDASTDGSKEVISSYGDRVTPIIKDKNEGQLSAYNTGFAKAHGDIICVLDGDDSFYPDKVEKLVNVFKNSPDFSSLLVYHELNCIDPDGRALDSKVPAPILHQVPTNIYEQVCDRNLTPADFSFATSSGIAISHELARSIFPLPENENLKARADSFVYTLAALLGKVYGINQALGAFRIHRDNYHQKHQKLSNERLIFVIALEKFLNQKLKENHKKPVVNLLGTIFLFIKNMFLITIRQNVIAVN